MKYQKKLLKYFTFYLLDSKMKYTFTSSTNETKNKMKQLEAIGPFTITVKENSHCALIWFGNDLIKCIAGDIWYEPKHETANDKGYANNAMKKATTYVNENLMK